MKELFLLIDTFRYGCDSGADLLGAQTASLLPLTAQFLVGEGERLTVGAVRAFMACSSR